MLHLWFVAQLIFGLPLGYHSCPGLVSIEGLVLTAAGDNYLARLPWTPCGGLLLPQGLSPPKCCMGDWEVDSQQMSWDAKAAVSTGRSACFKEASGTDSLAVVEFCLIMKIYSPEVFTSIASVLNTFRIMFTSSNCLVSSLALQEHLDLQEFPHFTFLLSSSLLLLLLEIVSHLQLAKALLQMAGVFLFVFLFFCFFFLFSPSPFPFLLSLVSFFFFYFFIFCF